MREAQGLAITPWRYMKTPSIEASGKLLCLNVQPLPNGAQLGGTEKNTVTPFGVLSWFGITIPLAGKLVAIILVDGSMVPTNHAKVLKVPPPNPVAGTCRRSMTLEESITMSLPDGSVLVMLTEKRTNCPVSYGAGSV